MPPRRPQPMPRKEGLRLRLVLLNETGRKIDLKAEPVMEYAGVAPGRHGVLEFLGGELPADIEITIRDGELQVEEMGPPYVAEIETFVLEDAEDAARGRG